MDETKEENLKRTRVHRILVHSYTTYFALFLIGVVLDLIFKVEMFTHPVWPPSGIILSVFGSFLIIWAQKTSRDFAKDHPSSKVFHRGPYRFTRHPTYLGLSLLMLGFGIVSNAEFVVLSTLASLLITHFVFIKKEEAELAHKYGDSYHSYKKRVKF